MLHLTSKENEIFKSFLGEVFGRDGAMEQRLSILLFFSFYLFSPFDPYLFIGNKSHVILY